MNDVLVAAFVSFAAAVIAVVIGQVLGQFFQSRADERRWAREDASRRRQNAEEMARAARDELLAATEQLSWDAGWARAKAYANEHPTHAHNASWVGAWDHEVDSRTAQARRLLLDVPDPVVRKFVDQAASILEFADTIARWGGPSEPDTARQVAAAVDDVIGAYRRGEALPQPPVIPSLIAIIDDYWETTERDRADDEKAEKAKPRGAKGSSSAQAPKPQRTSSRVAATIPPKEEVDG